MSDNKRKADSEENKTKKKKYRSDGTPIWAKRHIDGPGVWVSCVKGKEKQTAGEIYDLFESISSELWPQSKDEPEEELSIEAQIAKEVSAMKKPRTEETGHSFSNCQTNTPCVIFISCKPPVNPVELVIQYVKSVEKTGVTRTRYTHRLVPVSDSCVANLPEIEALCRRVFEVFFERHNDQKFSYKIELRVRNHSTIPRPLLIQSVAAQVPEGHTVDLQNPQIFILIEVFKSVCGVSIVEDYYRLQKFNVMEIANKKNLADSPTESRVKATKETPLGAPRTEETVDSQET